MSACRYASDARVFWRHCSAHAVWSFRTKASQFRYFIHNWRAVMHCRPDKSAAQPKKPVQRGAGSGARLSAGAISVNRRHAARHPDVPCIWPTLTAVLFIKRDAACLLAWCCMFSTAPLATGYGKGVGTRPAVPMQLPPEVDETVRNHYPKRPTLTDAGVATMKVRLLAFANTVFLNAFGAHLLCCELSC
jgi:hypothetical protein